MTKSNWVNYGDINPLEHGGNWLKQIDADEYDVIVVNPIPDEEGKFQVGATYINITDSWINKKEAMRYADIKELETSEDRTQFALAVVEYHGVVNCGGSLEVMNKEDTIKYLETFEIDIGDEDNVDNEPG